MPLEGSTIDEDLDKELLEQPAMIAAADNIWKDLTNFITLRTELHEEVYNDLRVLIFPSVIRAQLAKS
jgi:hypothetical protein